MLQGRPSILTQFKIKLQSASIVFYFSQYYTAVADHEAVYPVTVP